MVIMVYVLWSVCFTAGIFYLKNAFCQSPPFIIYWSRKSWKSTSTDGILSQVYDQCFFLPHNHIVTMCYLVLHSKIKGWQYIQPAEPQLTAHCSLCNIYRLQSDSLPNHSELEHFCSRAGHRKIGTCFFPPFVLKIRAKFAWKWKTKQKVTFKKC